MIELTSAIEYWGYNLTLISILLIGCLWFAFLCCIAHYKNKKNEKQFNKFYNERQIKADFDKEIKIFYNERQMKADFDKEIEMIKLISTTNLENPVEKEILYKKIMMLSALLSEAKRQKVEQFAKKVFEEIK